MAFRLRARLSLSAPLAALGVFVIVGFILGFGGACYRPSIEDGKLACSGARNLCPDGFRCGGDFRCFRITRDGGVPPLSDGGAAGDAGDDRPPDALLEAGAERPDGDSGTPDGRMDGGDADVGCFPPKPSCVPTDTGLCDPYCQTGCGCNRKCSVNTDRDLTCNAPASGPTRVSGEPCTIFSEGTNNQTDNCQPGLVCIEDFCGRRLCQPFCRSDADCPNAACTRDVGGGNRVCDVPFVDTCVPLPGSNNTGCTSVSMNAGCYLSSSHPTHTVCDCPNDSKPANADCVRSRECLPGLVCVDPNGAGSICLRVCRVNGPPSDCPNNQTCREYRGSNLGNPPHPTYGYCF